MDYMKRIPGLIIMLLLAASHAFAVQGYYVEFKMTSVISGGVNPTGTMKLYGTVAGDARSEMNMALAQVPGGGINLITLVKKSEPKKVYMIYESSKTYSITDAAKSSYKDDASYEIAVIGTETVNGYKATHVKVTSNKQVTELWLSTAVANYDHLSKLQGNKYYGDIKILAALKAKGVEGFPVRIMTQESIGKVQLDLVKAASQEIPAAMLEIPAGYKEGSPYDGLMKQLGLPSMDEIQNMTPEQREEFMKQYQQKAGSNK
jgi:hypothetical protein